MKVCELIDLLKSCNPDDVVLLSIDPEGNNFHELAAAEPMRRPEHDGGQHGDPQLRQLSEEDMELGYDEEDVCRVGQDVVVLWP